MTVQVSRFTNGGYVAHKLRYNSDFCKLHFSVWFDESGNVLDVEAFDSRGKGRAVPQKVRRVIGAEFGYVVAMWRASQAGGQ